MGYAQPFPVKRALPGNIRSHLTGFGDRLEAAAKREPDDSDGGDDAGESPSVCQLQVLGQRADPRDGYGPFELGVKLQWRRGVTGRRSVVGEGGVILSQSFVLIDLREPKFRQISRRGVPQIVGIEAFGLVRWTQI